MPVGSLHGSALQGLDGIKIPKNFVRPSPRETVVNVPSCCRANDPKNGLITDHCE